jgi:hypothetical protein
MTGVVTSVEHELNQLVAWVGGEQVHRRLTGVQAKFINDRIAKIREAAKPKEG